MTMLDRVRIILVRPQTGGNIGSAARAMLNFGLTDLVLVAPTGDPIDEQARAFAARARPMLERVRIVQTLADATRDCVCTFAASAKGGFHRQRAAVSAREAARLAVRAAAIGGAGGSTAANGEARGATAAIEGACGATAAIAFGPEDRGLLLEEILEFDRVLEIPANPDYAALNLAAAVTVVCYELRMALLEHDGRSSSAPLDPPASDERKRVMYEKLFAALADIGFFEHQQDENHLKFALRRVLGRADVSINEVDVLIGMAQQIQRAAKRDSRRPQ